MKSPRSYLLLFLLMFFSYETFATHLVGGSMSYEYLGRQNNGLYRYRVTIKMYRDCWASNVAFDNSIDVGVYNNNSNRTLSKVATFNKLTESQVDPPSGGSSCPFQPPVCLRQAFYQGVVDLDPSTVGYHLAYQRCCRNTQENILDHLGQTYYAFIPATAIANNSPYFTEVPAPYICINDLVSVFNTAKDVDGDSLVYRLATPWTGGSNNDPVPMLPSSWPAIPNFDPVIYKSGYNTNIPFGTAGTANINSRNGVTELLSPRTGRFSIAIDVFEYRNGTLLSAIRLDIQMIVINCTPNKTPTVSTSLNKFDFEVVEGEQICFDILSSDEDGDNIKISASGDIFTGSPGFGNVASFVNKSGTGSVSSQFCWTPSCGRASNTPYLFTVESQDDGCPPKKRLENISILVKPFVGIKSVLGDSQVCANTRNSIYTVSGSPTSTYNWTITGGVLMSGQNTRTISVDWGAGPGGNVKVVETSSGGCPNGNDVQMNVSILPAPKAPLISGSDTVCEFSSSITYSVPNVTGNTFQWIVNGGNISGASNTNAVTVNWLAKGPGVVAVIQTNNLGCGSDTAFFYVSKERSEIDSLLGSPSVCPNIRAVEYSVFNPNPRSTYVWSISGGTQASGANTSRITVDWGGIGNGYVEVFEISVHNCISDPVRMNVIINHALQGMVPLGDDTLCELSTGVKYEVIYTNGSIYNWSVDNGTIVQDNQSNSILVDWGTAGIGRVMIQEISFDSVNNLPCIGIPRTLNVFLAPYPVANPIIGVDEICQTEDEELFHIAEMTGSTFLWTFSGTSGIKDQGDDSIYLILNEPGQFKLTTIETSVHGCVGPEVEKDITVHPKPVTKGIVGDDIICFPKYANRVYSVEGYANSNYVWTANGATINSGQGTNTVDLTFNGQANNSMNVQEISEFGCVGDILTKDVFADDPSIDMKVISVSLADDSKMEVSWTLVNAPRYNSNFLVQRRVAGQGNSSWTSAGTTAGTEFTFLDKNLNTDKIIYEYRIIGYNLCGDSLYSEVHRNVQITGSKDEEDEYAVWVDWSRYMGWTDGVMTYELHRKDGNAPYSLINNAGLDTSDNFTDGTKSFQQCYRVKAFENNGTEISWSNEICFTFNPILLVPNAFTPNSDGLNTYFETVSASIKTYSITIYDRWGEILYEGDDVTKFWDGTFKGKPCQEGVYVYMIRYTGYDDRPKFLRGNVTILR